MVVPSTQLNYLRDLLSTVKDLKIEVNKAKIEFDKKSAALKDAELLFEKATEAVTKQELLNWYINCKNRSMKRRKKKISESEIKQAPLVISSTSLELAPLLSEIGSVSGPEYGPASRPDSESEIELDKRYAFVYKYSGKAQTQYELTAKSLPCLIKEINKNFGFDMNWYLDYGVDSYVDCFPVLKNLLYPRNMNHFAVMKDGVDIYNSDYR